MLRARIIGASFLALIFRVGGRARLQANFDVYNVLNAGAILGVNATYGRQWLLPVAATVGTEAILQGRLIQLGGQLTF